MKFKDDIEKDTFLKDYAERKLYWRNRNSYYHDSIARLLAKHIPPQSAILEIGCGTGETLAYLKPSEGTGVDINPYLISEGRKGHPHLNFVEADAESDNPFEILLKQDKTYDYIILSDLIGTLDDIQKLLEKLNLLSHSDTRIIVTYYNYFWNPLLKAGEYMKLKMKEGEKNWLYIEEIKNLLYLSNYEVVKSGSALLIPKNVPLISLMFNSVLARLPFFRRLCLVGWVLARFNKQKKIHEGYRVSLVIPCRNEEGNIKKIIERIPEIGSSTELIFVEGNSTDNTYEKIRSLIPLYPDKNIRLFRQDGKGKADAVRKGFENASGDIFIILDADMTVAPEDMNKFYDALAGGKGRFINGTRLVYQMEERAMRRLNKFGNIFFSKAFSWLLSQRITDTLCGTKALFREDYLRIAGGRKYFGDFDPFGDFDLLFGASRLNLKIIEIPVRYGERKYGETNISRFRDGMLLLKMCFVALRKIKLAGKK